MRYRIILWLFRQLMTKESFEALPKLSENQRTVAYNEAYEIENFKEIIQKQINSYMKTIAVRAMPDEEIAFNRGVMYASQLLLQNMRKSHDLILKRKNYAVDEKGN